ncbi:DUF1045 domain-containing protein [Dyella sp. LX-66]|uniref:DUF1045 domain-containing protein n=1 Tax=unclassified Dyella TaxID=2634549 RepID=UPI001BDFD22C|nr:MULTISPECIES: DUF1045 domain-containing protein [unclassified Dyella]MBT2116918.1 DUF1045 domain-containing protein [Dyella sp. LX-1]MBT2138902.1 DUF1045 domain-containing protein [Dyella sp. LX-66]
MRYAIYYCPARDSALGRFGEEWLAGADVMGLVPARRDVLLADARRYGWHATLRAPFALAQGRDHGDLCRAIVKVAREHGSFVLPLRLDRLAGFLALRPAGGSAAIDALAAACLHATDTLRAPLAAEALRKRAAGLDAAELAYLQKYGYPYVLDRYRFHMTLAAPAAAAEEQAMQAWLAPRVSALLPAPIDALAICREPAPGSAFETIERIALEPRA